MSQMNYLTHTYYTLFSNVISLYVHHNPLRESFPFSLLYRREVRWPAKVTQCASGQESHLRMTEFESLSCTRTTWDLKWEEGRTFDSRPGSTPGQSSDPGTTPPPLQSPTSAGPHTGHGTATALPTFRPQCPTRPGCTRPGEEASFAQIAPHGLWIVGKRAMNL